MMNQKKEKLYLIMYAILPILTLYISKNIWEYIYQRMNAQALVSYNQIILCVYYICLGICICFVAQMQFTQYARQAMICNVFYLVLFLLTTVGMITSLSILPDSLFYWLRSSDTILWIWLGVFAYQIIKNIIFAYKN